MRRCAASGPPCLFRKQTRERDYYIVQSSVRSLIIEIIRKINRIIVVVNCFSFSFLVFRISANQMLQSFYCKVFIILSLFLLSRELSVIELEKILWHHAGCYTLHFGAGFARIHPHPDHRLLHISRTLNGPQKEKHFFQMTVCTQTQLNCRK